MGQTISTTSTTTTWKAGNLRQTNRWARSPGLTLKSRHTHNCFRFYIWWMVCEFLYGGWPFFLLFIDHSQKVRSGTFRVLVAHIKSTFQLIAIDLFDNGLWWWSAGGRRLYDRLDVDGLGLHLFWEFAGCKLAGRLIVMPGKFMMIMLWVAVLTLAVFVLVCVSIKFPTSAAEKDLCPTRLCHMRRLHQLSGKESDGILVRRNGIIHMCWKVDSLAMAWWRESSDKKGTTW